MKTTIDFTQDNFTARRASQSGAGVAYDPQSLLTGEEIERGLDYDAPRTLPAFNTTCHDLWHAAVIGNIPVIHPITRENNIATFAPRAYRSPEAHQHAAMARACHPPVVDQWTLDFTAWRNDPDRMARFTAEVDPIGLSSAVARYEELVKG